MPEICRFYGIIIRMFFREHSPPHFHAEYGDKEASISIDTLAVISGGLPPRTLGLVVEWASLHKDELRTDWELALNHERPLKIRPLE